MKKLLLAWLLIFGVANADNHKVIIEAMKYTPADLMARAGDSITWTNKDFFPHTVTASDGSFNSHSIAPSSSWTFIVKKKGRFRYKCLFHPTMNATLTVH